MSQIVKPSAVFQADLHQLSDQLFISREVDLPIIIYNVIPQNTITLGGENLVKFTRMLDGLEDNDDVQRVFHNVDLPEEEEEE